MSTDVVEKLKIVEEIVKIPWYGVVGITQNKLIYMSTREGIRNLWALDLETNESLRLTKKGVSGVADIKTKSPLVIYTRDVTGGKELHNVYSININELREKVIVDFKPRRIFGISFDGERIALSCAGEKEVEIYIAKTEGKYEKIYELKALAIVTSNDKNLVTGYGSFKDPKTFELFIYNLEDGNFKIYTPREGSTCKPPKVHDGKILFSTNAFREEKMMIYDFYEEELKEPELPYEDHKKYKFSEYISYGWTEDGRIWFIGGIKGRTKLFIDGKEIRLPQGSADNACIHGDEVYVTWSSAKKPTRILKINLKNNEVEDFLGAKLPEHISKSFGDVKYVEYESFDGLKIPMYIFESKKASKPGAVIIYVHGGPWAEVKDSWNRTISSLIASGYHVLAPNFRGSTGYGEEFRRLDIGDPGGGDLMDIVYARKYAIENGYVDGDKIAIMGYSYGGFMTYLATVKHPDLWKCGVAGAGIVDWEEMYYLSDTIFKQFINILFAGKKELWKDRSAINFADKLKAPLCIIHPQNDTRTPLKPVLKYCMKLLEKGKTFEVHIAPDMGHIIMKIDDAIKILFPAIIFLERYLK